jgi:hypothetical protein
MENLATRLGDVGISFDPVDRRIMCFPHTINIACQHLIKSFTNIDFADTDDDVLSVLPELQASGRQSFDEAVQRDPIALGRNIVRVIRSSGQRREGFKSVIRDGNEKGWFVENNVVHKVEELQLLRDVKTRWDSVFLMIQRLRMLRQVRHYHDST